MKFSAVLAVMFLGGFAGCTSTSTDPNDMVGETTSYANPTTVADIESLTPQLKFPIKLAVSQPSTWNAWTEPEIAEIESWEEPLQQLGLITELVVLPASFSNSCGWRSSYNCQTQTERLTAARFGADAVLMMSTQTSSEQDANALSILNLTIIGMWVAPGHRRTSSTVLEGTLVDVRNEFVYAFHRAFGTKTSVRPLIYAEYDLNHGESRLVALNAFGENLIEQMRANPLK